MFYYKIYIKFHQLIVWCKIKSVSLKKKASFLLVINFCGKFFQKRKKKLFVELGVVVVIWSLFIYSIIVASFGWVTGAIITLYKIYNFACQSVPLAVYSGVISFINKNKYNFGTRYFKVTKGTKQQNMNTISNNIFITACNQSIPILFNLSGWCITSKFKMQIEEDFYNWFLNSRFFKLGRFIIDGINGKKESIFNVLNCQKPI